MFEEFCSITIPVKGTGQSILLTAAAQGCEILLEHTDGNVTLIMDFNIEEFTTIRAQLTAIIAAMDSLTTNAEAEADYLEAHDATGQGGSDK